MGGCLLNEMRSRHLEVQTAIHMLFVNAGLPKCIVGNSVGLKVQTQDEH